jgi:DNA-binding NtrC family response regulator
VLLFRQQPGPDGDAERNVLRQTIDAIRAIEPGIRVDSEAWSSPDPTDHKAIFEFLQRLAPKIRKRFAGIELLVHISPGTPSMQTIWVLMGETGLIDPPLTLVKSYRPSERHGKPAVVRVEVGIETFYKAYKQCRPRQVTDDQILLWDPAKFRSSCLRQLFEEARRLAHLKVPVLILGERGTGKTTLAAWIRTNSPFRRPAQDGHWPSVTCGQYSPETMRAELFGYKKGSFTGAHHDKEGLLAAADQDTLFLDEIGDVSKDLQRLLIRALEEKQYFALGDDKAKKSDFRLLSATNLTQKVLDARIDPDFLDRIGVLTIRVPSIREMPDDLPWLWEAVYAIAQERSGVDQSRCALPKTAHKGVVAALRSNPLTGNLRDLFRVAYRILAAIGDPLQPLTIQNALEYGLAPLDHAPGQQTGSAVTREIARHFASNEPLDDLVSAASPLPTGGLDQDLKRFVATELRRIAKRKGLPVTQLCDVTDRTLRSWLSADA